MFEEDEAALRRHRALARDAAISRLRRSTAGVIAGAVALGGAFAALAAASPGKKTISRAPVRQHAVRLPVLEAAPAAPLVSVAPGESSGQSAPYSPPTSSYAPPVVSSGGS